MGDVRLAALTELTAVTLVGDGVGALHLPQVGLGVRGADQAEQRLELRRGLGAAGGAEAGQPGPDPGRCGRDVVGVGEVVECALG